MTVSSTSLTITPDGVPNGDILVNAQNTDWSVDVTSGREWLSAFKNGNKVSVTAKENTGTSERSGQIVVTSTADSRLSCTIMVTQSGNSAYITINGSETGEYTFPGKFDTGKSGIDYKETFKIKSNVQWTLTADDDSWLNISPKSGNGDVDLNIYPKSENNTDSPRTARLTISGGGVSKSIVIIQEGGLIVCYVKPVNEIALYNSMCWEYEGTENVNEFQWILLSESDCNAMTDNKIIEKIKETETLSNPSSYISSTSYDDNKSRIQASSTYYLITLASDKDGNYGALKKTKIETPRFYNGDDDAYVYCSNFSHSTYTFQFDVKKMGRCTTYHIIYGNYSGYLHSALLAFEINYYLKHQEKHWLARSNGWEIMDNYPNDHTFSHITFTLDTKPICFGYGWGMFSDGTLSSDLLGFQTDTSSSSAPQMPRTSHSSDSYRENICQDGVTIKK